MALLDFDNNLTLGPTAFNMGHRVIGGGKREDFINNRTNNARVNQFSNLAQLLAFSAHKQK